MNTLCLIYSPVFELYFLRINQRNKPRRPRCRRRVIFRTSVINRRDEIPVPYDRCTLTQHPMKYIAPCYIPPTIPSDSCQSKTDRFRFRPIGNECRPRRVICMPRIIIIIIIIRVPQVSTRENGRNAGVTRHFIGQPESFVVDAIKIVLAQEIF